MVFKELVMLNTSTWFRLGNANASQIIQGLNKIPCRLSVFQISNRFLFFLYYNFAREFFSPNKMKITNLAPLDILYLNIFHIFNN